MQESSQDNIRNKFLIELCSALLKELSTEEQKRYCKLFDRLYDDNFRHSYTEIARFITSEYTKQVQNFDTLIKNIAILIEHSKNGNTTKALKKLRDHIELILIRLDDQAQVNNQIEQIQANSNNIREGLDDFKKQYNALHNDLKRTKTELKNTTRRFKQLEKKLNNTTKHYVSVLAVFSAVIMTFFGGFSFSISLLKELYEAPLEKLLCAAAFLGFILFNILFLFLKVIREYSGDTDTYLEKVFYGVNSILLVILTPAILDILNGTHLLIIFTIGIVVWCTKTRPKNKKKSNTI